MHRKLFLNAKIIIIKIKVKKSNKSKFTLKYNKFIKCWTINYNNNIQKYVTQIH